MGLQINRGSTVKLRLLTIMVAAFALVAQPMYGLVASQVANAASNCSEICINEFQTNETNGSDWIEIYNPSGSNLGNYRLRDAIGNTKPVAAAGDGSSRTVVDFSNYLNVSGDTIYLELRDATNHNSWTIEDTVQYGGTAAIPAPAKDQSTGRTTDGASTWQVFTTPTKGASNKVVTPAPVIGVTTPADGATLTGNVQLNAAIDNYDASKPAHVAVYNFGTTTNSVFELDLKNAGGNNWNNITNFDTASLDNGQYDITFTVPNTTVAKTVTVTVDNSSPLIVPSNATATTVTGVKKLTSPAPAYYMLTYANLNVSQATKELQVTGSKVVDLAIIGHDPHEYVWQDGSKYTDRKVELYYKQSDDSWKVTTVQYDANGNLYKINGSVVDGYVNTGPKVTIDTPSSKYVSNRKSLTVSGTATDVQTHATRVAVYVKQNGTNHIYFSNANVAVHSDGTWNVTWNDSRIPNGTGFYIFVTGYDTASNGGKAGPTAKKWNFIADNTLPVVAITSTTPDSVTNGDVTVKGTIKDNFALDTAGTSGLVINIPNSAHAWTSCNPGTLQVSYTGSKDASFECTIDATKLPHDGTYELRVFAKDSAGNQSKPVTKDVTLDTTPPAVPSIVSVKATPSNKPINNGDHTATKAFQVNWTDGGSDVDHYIYKTWTDVSGTGHSTEVTAYTDSTLTTPTRTAYTKAGDGKTHEGASYYVEVAACDAAGNCSDFSPKFTLTYDTTAPKLMSGVSLSKYIAKDNTTSAAMNSSKNNELTLTVKTSEPIDKDSSTVQFYDPGTGKYYSLSNYHSDGGIKNGQYVYFFNVPLDVTGLSDATTKVNIVFHLCDGAGNCGDYTYNRNNDASKGVYVLTIDNESPVTPAVTVGSVTAGKQQVTVDPSDANVTFTYTDGTSVDGSLFSHAGNVYTINTSMMQKGTQITVSATSTDEVENTSAAGTASFTVDNADLAPVVTIAKDPTLGSDGKYTISGTSTAIGTPVTVTVTAAGSTTPLTFKPITDPKGVWLFTTELDGSTQYAIVASTTDQYGYVGMANSTYKIPPVNTGATVDNVSSLRDAFRTPNTPVNLAGTRTANKIARANKKSILGAQDLKGSGKDILGDTAALTPSATGWKLLGVAWYWWLLLVAVILALWRYLVVRRQASDNA